MYAVIPETTSPRPTVYVPSGTDFFATSSRRFVRLAIDLGAPGSCEESCDGETAETDGGRLADHNGRSMSTRMLILLAALCAVAILAASAIQILIAR